MIVKLEENKFLLIGSFCHVTFKPAGKDAGRAWEYLEAAEGSYNNGVFTAIQDT